MIQLRDIFKAPLDAAYLSLQESNNRAQRDMVAKHFHVASANEPAIAKKYDIPLQTLRPLENVFQFNNKNGIRQELKGPTIAFEHVTNMNVKDLMIDFDVSISEMRRRSDGELVVNAALNKGKDGDALNSGGFHFNIVYKNEVPSGVARLQGVFADVLDGQYMLIKDSEDISLQTQAEERLQTELLIQKLSKSILYIQRFVSHTTSETDSLSALSTLVDIVDRVKLFTKNADGIYPRQIHDMLMRLPRFASIEQHFGRVHHGSPGMDYGIIFRSQEVDSDSYTTDQMYTRKSSGDWDIPTNLTLATDTKLLIPVSLLVPTVSP
jgi:hypothetical protein